MLKVHDAFLNKLRYVGDLGEDLGIGASVCEAYEVVINCVNRSLVTIVNLQDIQLLVEPRLLSVVLRREFHFQLVSFLL